MSRPIKISDELYGMLADRALSSGIPIMDALREHLADLEGAVTNLRKELHAAQRQASQAEQAYSAAARDKATYQERLKRVEESLSQALAKGDAVQAELEELHADGDAAGEVMDALRKKAADARGDAARLRAERNGFGFMLIAVAAVGVVAWLWSEWKARRRQQTPHQEPPRQPVWPQPFGV